MNARLPGMTQSPAQTRELARRVTPRPFFRRVPTTDRERLLRCIELAEQLRLCTEIQNHLAEQLWLLETGRIARAF